MERRGTEVGGQGVSEVGRQGVSEVGVWASG